MVQLVKLTQLFTEIIKMGDVLLLDEWTDVHVALRDLQRTHMELSKTHDLMIIRRVTSKF